jgi:hypothetical protein
METLSEKVALGGGIVSIHGLAKVFSDTRGLRCWCAEAHLRPDESKDQDCS